MATVVELRNLMFQIHGRNYRQAKRMEREIPKLLKAESRLQQQRQIGSRLNCDRFSLSAFIDNSIDKAVPALHLFLPEPKSAKTHKRSNKIYRCIGLFRIFFHVFAKLVFITFANCDSNRQHKSEQQQRADAK